VLGPSPAPRLARVFAAGLARTFQIPRPFPRMTVLENVMLAPTGQLGERFWTNWLRSAVARRSASCAQAAMHWLDFVGLLGPRTAKRQRALGGQRKLLELARAMVAQACAWCCWTSPARALTRRCWTSSSTAWPSSTARAPPSSSSSTTWTWSPSLCRPVMVMAQGRLLAQGDAAGVLAELRRVVEA
jgi:branched-chain amino acid transport system ATP-binding protein